MAKIGFALTGSFCTFKEIFSVMDTLVSEGYDIYPIMSFNAAQMDTKFGKAADFLKLCEQKCGRTVITTI
ncbi:MAG TPA: flavoprotein, partial [Clostridia bacterium]|nr:flavoprotein [Clostridia bacterium]